MFPVKNYRWVLKLPVVDDMFFFFWLNLVLLMCFIKNYNKIFQNWSAPNILELTLHVKKLNSDYLLNRRDDFNEICTVQRLRVSASLHIKKISTSWRGVELQTVMCTHFFKTFPKSIKQKKSAYHNENRTHKHPHIVFIIIITNIWNQNRVSLSRCTNDNTTVHTDTGFCTTVLFLEYGGWRVISPLSVDWSRTKQKLTSYMQFSLA